MPRGLGLNRSKPVSQVSDRVFEAEVEVEQAVKYLGLASDVARYKFGVARYGVLEDGGEREGALAA